MKNIILIALFLFCNSINAQKLSDYKYVYVPDNFKEFANNQFELNSTLVKYLKKKGYEVIQGDKRDWPESLKQNPCEVALVDVSKSGNMFTTKLTFVAKDCNGKVLMSQQGISQEKDFELGYKESLQKILVNVTNSSPVIKMAEVKAIFVEKTEPLEKVERIEKLEKPEKLENTNTINNSQNYTNGTLLLQKILIGNGKFILVNKNSSVPYATFTESGKKDVFHVVLENGSMTLGYLENGNYSIDIPNKDGSFRNEVFEKK